MLKGPAFHLAQSSSLLISVLVLPEADWDIREHPQRLPINRGEIIDVGATLTVRMMLISFASVGQARLRPGVPFDALRIFPRSPKVCLLLFVRKRKAQGWEPTAKD